MDAIPHLSSHGTGSFERDHFKKLGENVIFEPGCLVFHPERIEIGDRVYVGHYAILKGYHKGLLRIGNGTWIGQGAFLHAAGDLLLGERVGVGPGVKIITSFHEEGKGTQPVMDGVLCFKSVVVEDGADIGVGAIVLPGVRVGKGSLIGAGSVVTRDVEPGWIVAGNPARPLRRRGQPS